MSIDTVIKNIMFRSDDSLLLITLENLEFPRSWVGGRVFDLLVPESWGPFEIRWRKYHIWDFLTGRWKPISEFPSHAEVATPDPSARWIAYDDQQSPNQRNACLSLFDITLNTSRSALTLSDSIGQIENIVFSCDGCSVAASWGSYHISAWNISTGAAIGTLTVLDHIQRLALCSSRTKIAIVTWLPDTLIDTKPYVLTVFEIMSGNVLWALDLDHKITSILDFSSNGEALILHHRLTCGIYDSTTGALQQRFSWHNYDIDDTFSTFESGARHHHVAIADRRKCRLFIVEASEIHMPVENSHDDKFFNTDFVVHCAPHATDILLEYKEKVEIWNVETGSMVRSLVQNPDTKNCQILEYHDGYIITIYNLSYDPFDDHCLIATSWRVEDHHLSQEVMRHGVTYWAVSQSGFLIAFTDISTDVFVHNLKDHGVVRLMCDRAIHHRIPETPDILRSW